MSRTGPGCSAHGRSAEELRGFADQLAARLQPLLERLAQDDAAGQPESSGEPCTWCPVCALITVLRGDRPEAVARLAEHGAGLLAAVRELLNTAAGEPAAAGAAPGEPASGADRSRQRTSGRSVQHIEVRPAAGGADGAAGC